MITPRGSFTSRGLALAVLFALAGPAAAQGTTLASGALGGGAANAMSFSPAMAANGRYVAFTSFATNLVASDANGLDDVFLRDTQLGTTTNMSVNSSGVASNGHSAAACLSSDGRYVAFLCTATNMFAGAPGTLQAVVRDRMTGTTIPASVTAGGVPANNYLAWVDISGDGRYVAFGTDASNLVAGDANGQIDIFVKDLQTGAVTLDSLSTFGSQANAACTNPDLSADGRYVAFLSSSITLVLGDSNGKIDVFLRDRQLAQTTRISLDSTGQQANGDSGLPSISGDGNRIAFESDATNLVAGDTNGATDIFVKDRSTGKTLRVSVNSAGVQGDGPSSGASISLDGRYVAFNSDATNLVAGDTNGASDVFVHDLLSGTTVRASVGPGGAEAPASSYSPSLSGNGRYVAFSSDADIAGDDTNSLTDVYVRDDFVPWLSLGPALAGGLGAPSLSGSGTVAGGSVITLSVAGAKPLSPTDLVVGFTALLAPLKGGVLVPHPDLLFPIPTDAAGAIVFPALWPLGVPAGLHLYFQSWIVDASGPKGLTATNGLELTTP